MRYADYCTAFYDEKENTVYFYNEMTDRMLGKKKVKDEEEAMCVMRIWQDNAPKGIICSVLKC